MMVAAPRASSSSDNSYYLMALTLKFDLLLKNFNLGCYLIMVAAPRVSLSSDNSYYLMALTLKFDVLLKNFNLGCYLIMVSPASVVVFWQLLL